jgi:parallel beta-helix repeat protein
MTALAVGQVMMWNGSLWVNAELAETAVVSAQYDVRRFGVFTADSAAAAATNRATINTAIVAANAASVALTGPLEVLIPGGFYYISGTITVLSGVTLRGAGMGKTILRMPASAYTNTVMQTYDATSVAISCNGQTSSPYAPTLNITLCDFSVESDTDDGRVLYPVLARNSRRLHIHHVEISQIPCGNCITLDSVSVGWIHHCYLHDCTSSSANSLQLTGIETDNNRINSVNCNALDIHDNTIVALTFTGAAFPGSQNMQTDGINLGLGSNHQINVHDNYIANVGEGIDNFSSNCTIHSNTLVDCNNVGIKHIHGASYNHVYGNTIARPGLAGLYMGGSVAAASDWNYFHDNSIHDVGGNGDVWASNTPAGILIDATALAFACNNNTFARNKITGGASNMDYAIRHEEGTGNRFYDNEAESWTIAYSSIAGGSATIQNAKKALVRASRNTDQSTSAGVATLVNFANEEIDTQSEYDTGTFTYTASCHRRIRVLARVRVGTGGAGENNQLRIRKNGTTRAESTEWSGGATESFSVEDVFEVVKGDTVDIQFFQNNGTRAIKGGAEQTYLTIEEVAC